MEKKKYKRRVVGSVLKDSKDPTKSYIKIREDIVLKGGSTLSLESPAQQLASAEAACAAGKITEEIMQSIRERIAKVPDYVRFEILQLTQE